MRWVSENSYQPATYLNNRLKGWNSPQGQSIVIIAGSREYRCLAPVYSGARAIINDFADEIRQLGLSNFVYCDDDAMVASVPMTGDHWQPLEAGTLLVLKEGKVVNRSNT